MSTADQVLGDKTVRLVLITRSYMTAVYAILLWDWIVTFKTEYETVWKGKRTTVKYLFLFLRYYTILSTAVSLAFVQGNWTESVCEKYYLLQPFLGMWGTVCADTILLLRCYAIWEKNRTILLGGLLGLIGMIIAQIFASLATAPIPVPAGLTKFTCTTRPKPGSNVNLAMFLAPFIFETLVTLLTVYRALVYSRRSGGMSSNLLQRFVHGGIVYMLCVETLNLLNVVFLLQTGIPAIQPINAGATLILTSLLAQRLVLHLRGTVEHTMDPETFGFISTQPQTHPSNMGGSTTTSDRSREPPSAVILKKLGIFGNSGSGLAGDSDESAKVHAQNHGLGVVGANGAGMGDAYVGLRIPNEDSAEKGFSSLSKQESMDNWSYFASPTSPQSHGLPEVHYSGANGNGSDARRVRGLQVPGISVNVETERRYSHDPNPPMLRRPEVASPHYPPT